MQILETAFKKETVGLVTREQYVEKVKMSFFVVVVVVVVVGNVMLLYWSRDFVTQTCSDMGLVLFLL